MYGISSDEDEHDDWMHEEHEESLEIGLHDTAEDVADAANVDEDDNASRSNRFYLDLLELYGQNNIPSIPSLPAPIIKSALARLLRRRPRSFSTLSNDSRYT
ncbi:unnamed protein product [Mucor fragilis]